MPVAHKWLPEWIIDARESVDRIKRRNRERGPHLYSGTEDLFPGFKAAPLHRQPQPPPLDTDPDPSEDKRP